MSEKEMPKPKWIEADHNPFGVRILDCSEIASGMIATSGDKKIAESFARDSEYAGDQYRNRLPGNKIEIECNIEYPKIQNLADGPLFIASVMEDKWDIFLFDNYLYIVRSWARSKQDNTGLVFRAQVEMTEEKLILQFLQACAKPVEGDRDFALRQADFLLKSYLFNHRAPHPLPSSMVAQNLKDEDLATYSFFIYGRRGLFATFEDTLGVDVFHVS